MTSRWLAAATAVAAAALAAIVVRRWHLWRASRLAGHRARRGLAAEERAAKLLEQRGFVVLDSRPSARWTVVQDGAAHELRLRGDYLVTRRGRRFLAEVKTGDAADLRASAATRRQLLEYLLAFEVDGVILVCPDTRAVHRVELPGAQLRRRSLAPAVLTALGVGCALGLAGARALWG